MQVRMDEISKHKLTIMRKLLSDDNLVKAVYHNTTDFLEKPTVDVSQLVYRNIFPYRYVPTTTEEARTYITMSVTYRKSGSYFKVGNITVFVFTNQNLMQTDYEGVLRIDYIISRIDTIMNKSNSFGIGKLELDMVDELLVEGKMPGMVIRYRTVDVQ